MQFNLADLFEAVVDTNPDRVALVSGERRLTYKALDERSNRLANFLKSRGVKAGDHVGLHMYNGNEYMEASLAALKLRAVPINLNYRYVAHELRYLVENAELRAVLSQRELAPVVEESVAGLDGVHTFIFLEDGSDVAPPSSLEPFDYDTVLEQSSAERDFEERSGDDLYIIYTGGTTGMPKGVMWRQEDLVFSALQGANPGGDPLETPEQIRETSEGEGACFLPCAPFIHGAAQLSGWICLFGGGRLVLQPGRSFDPKRVCELLGEEEVTTLTVVGDAMARPIADELAANKDKYDGRALYVIASAGAILSPAVKDKLEEVLPDCVVLNNFGASETGHQGSALPGEEVGQEGRPSFEMDESNTVLDDDFKPIEPGSGQIGRLAKGGRVPLGYYKDEAKTKERFVTLDGKRWVLPGDFATIEADGRITVYGRGSNCINTGGEKVFPEEVEEALKAHPDVFDCLVVGVEDDKWMQRVAAVVQPRPGAKPTLKQLQEHARTLVAGYKVPRQLTLADKVERFPSGKPDYKWARERAAEPDESMTV